MPDLRSRGCACYLLFRRERPFDPERRRNSRSLRKIGWKTPRRLHFEGRGRTATPQGPREAVYVVSDTQTDMLPREPESAICVQRFDDSLNSAIHTTYRSWLRSSSMHEPRDPPLKVVSLFVLLLSLSLSRLEKKIKRRRKREGRRRRTPIPERRASHLALRLDSRSRQRRSIAPVSCACVVSRGGRSGKRRCPVRDDSI